MKWFMNLPVSHLANTKELHRAGEKERVLQAEREWKKKVISRECIVLGKVTFPGGMEDAYQ